MALLTREAEDKIVNLLVSEGLTDSNIVFSLKQQLELENKPVLDELIKKGVINSDMVARATAAIIGVPYIELKNVTLDQDVLSLIPAEASMRVMAVPLGEKDGMLNIAMADVTNVQATDYLSSLVNMPIRGWMSSEHGVREMLEQYHGDFSSVNEAVKETTEEVA